MRKSMSIQSIRADEGYFFGIGAFETIGVEDGIPLLLEEHCRRLEHTLHFLKLSFPLEELEHKMQETLDMPEMKKGRQALKITVSAQNLLVTVRSNPYGTEDYDKGFVTDYAQVRRNETSPFTYHKTLNYGDCLWEKRKALEQGVQEAIFCNTRGAIAEGTSTNVFFVKQGRICTPAVSCGLLPGILRKYLCERYEVEEREILPREVEEMEEMFLTNSLMGIMPVTSLGTHKFVSREISRRLMQEYQDFCRMSARSASGVEVG